jgi:diguanylate cyclase (GGDEF)-like protein
MAAAWFLSRRWAIAILVLAAVSGFVVGEIERDHGWLVLVANHLLRTGSYVLFALFVVAVRQGFADLIDTARLDQMTGVLSRAGFLEELAAARRRAIDRETPLGVLYLDLDGLKAVNDREGHEAGDRLIQRFVDGVERHLRTTDLFGRLGGDEFAIVLERVDPLVIDGVIARLLSDPELPDVSCGVRVFEGAYPPIDQMLAGADRRMYEDKQRRRARQLP